MTVENRQLIAAWTAHPPPMTTADRPPQVRAPGHQASVRTILASYYAAVLVAVVLGVTATYWWARHDELSEHAARTSAKAAQLAARMAELEGEHARTNVRMLALAAEAMRGNGESVLAELDAMAGRQPALADTATFARLRALAHEHEEQVTKFETALGGTPWESPPWEGVPEAPRDISIRAREESWIQIVDRETRLPTFTRQLKPGETYSLAPSPESLLITGNAGGLEISVDGVAAPAFPSTAPWRREISLDPARLLAGTADETKPKATPAP